MPTRTKDLIKSGGEWISSVELDDHLMSHPDVAEAAVIAVPSERWMERPMACVVVKDGATLTPDQVRAWLAPRVARLWLPDAVEFNRRDSQDIRGQVLEEGSPQPFR
jgi:fatty-acyl-CoA synthase